MRTTTVVIGAGHGGLAMSRCLSDRSIDHVVLERGEVANSWRTERWDSLRLLTPNWQCRLPGYAYQGDDPDGFMTMPEVVDVHHRATRRRIAAPVQTGTTVTSVRRTDGGYRVITDQGEWECLTVVLATGAFNVPRVPAVAEAVPAVGDDAHADDVPQPRPARRGRRAGGRRVGERGADRPRDPALGPAGHVGRRRARPGAPRVPRPGHPLVDGGGRRARRALRRGGRHRAGPPRAVDAARRLARASDLRPQRAHGHRRAAGRSLGRHPRRPRAVLRVVAEQVRAGRPQARPAARHRSTSGRPPTASTTSMPPPHRFAPTVVPESPPLGLDLTSGEIQTIIWATGFRPDYSWLDVDGARRQGDDPTRRVAWSSRPGCT